MKLVTFNPLTAVEKVVATRLGNDNWELLLDNNPWAVNMKPMMLICKPIDDEVKHMRWISKSQVISITKK